MAPWRVESLVTAVETLVAHSDRSYTRRTGQVHVIRVTGLKVRHQKILSSVRYTKNSPTERQRARDTAKGMSTESRPLHATSERGLVSTCRRRPPDRPNDVTMSLRRE